MSVRGWWRRRRQEKGKPTSRTPESRALREFVYLDEVSINSLLASRLGSIASEFTNSRSSSRNSEIESSLEANLGVSKGGTRAALQLQSAESTQTLRKSLVQGSFKELYDLEAESFLFGPEQGAAEGGPVIAQSPDWVAHAEAAGLAVRSESIQRGRLFEAQIELEAEEVFRVSEVISAVVEVVGENESIFGESSSTGMADAVAINQLLKTLLSGLIPLRGRLVDFCAVRHEGSELLVHNSLVEALAFDPAEVRPAFVVAVAERSLFWKDIRRVLFGNSKYRVLCRASGDGLQTSWQPVKLAEVLGEILPTIGEQISDFGTTAVSLMKASSAGSNDPDSVSETSRRAGRQFADSLVEHHGASIEVCELEELLDGIETPQKFGSVDERRPYLDGIRCAVDSRLNVTTSRELAAQLRAGLAQTHAGRESAEGAWPPPTKAQSELKDDRFIDIEVIGIYW